MSQVNYFSTIKESDLDQLDAYQIYCSVKQHFVNKKYDFTKYGQNKKSFNVEALISRPDAIFFKKLSDEYLYKERYIPLVVSNIYEDTGTWVKDLLDQECKQRGLKFRAYLNNPMEYFSNDIKNLVLSGEIFSDKELYSLNTKKNYFGLQTKKKIASLTASILNSIYYDKYLAKTSLSFVYADKANKLDKLFKFIPKDKLKVDESFVMDLIKDLQ